MRAALVTGGASGIGRAIAERLSADGWSVHAVDLGDGDLATREGNRAVVDAALERFGRLDAVVASAGFQHVSPVAEFPEERWDALVGVLLTSPFLLAKYAWDRTAARPEQEGRGVGNLIRLEQTLHRLRREDHVFENAFLRQAVGLGLVRDLRLDERRPHVGGAESARRDPHGGPFQREHLHEPEHAVLRGHVSGLERRGDEPVNGGHGEEAAVAARRTGTPFLMDLGWTAR